MSYCQEIFVSYCFPPYIIKILFLRKCVFICVLHKSIVYRNNFNAVIITFSTDKANNKNLTQFALCFTF